LTGAYRHFNPNTVISRATQLKTSYIRVMISWADVREIGGNALSRRAPRHVRYNFRPYDALWSRAGQQHILLQFTVTGPFPAWASATHRKSAFPNRRAYAAFGNFTGQLAQHFKGRVGIYGIWNDPNFRSWLSPMNSA